MVSKLQIDKWDARIDELERQMLGGDAMVAIFAGETQEFALARHLELRPEHAGMPLRYDARREERDEVYELFAVMTVREIQAVIARHDGETRSIRKRARSAGSATAGLQ